MKNDSFVSIKVIQGMPTPCTTLTPMNKISMSRHWLLLVESARTMTRKCCLSEIRQSQLFFVLLLGEFLLCNNRNDGDFKLNCLDCFSRDKLFPAFGFGARLPPTWQVSHEFPLVSPASGHTILVVVLGHEYFFAHERVWGLK